MNVCSACGLRLADCSMRMGALVTICFSEAVGALAVWKFDALRTIATIQLY